MLKALATIEPSPLIYDRHLIDSILVYMIRKCSHPMGTVKRMKEDTLHNNTVKHCKISYNKSASILEIMCTSECVLSLLFTY